VADGADDASGPPAAGAATDGWTPLYPCGDGGVFMIVVAGPRYERLIYHDHEKQGRAMIESTR
jgi:hypothetical protein